MECEGDNAMERVMQGHLGDCARNAKTYEVDVTSMSNFKNRLCNVPIRVHIDDHKAHKWLAELGHGEGNGLALVLGASWPATWILRRWGWEKEILLGLICCVKWWWWMVGALRGGANVVFQKGC